MMNLCFNQLDFFNVCVCFSFHTHGKSTVTEHVGEVQASISEETTSKEQGSPLEIFDVMASVKHSLVPVSLQLDF